MNMEASWGSGGGQGTWCASQEMVGGVLRVVVGSLVGSLVGASVGTWAVAANWCRCRCMVSGGCASVNVGGAWNSAGSKMTPGGRPKRGSWLVMGKEHPVTVLVMSFAETSMFILRVAMVGHPTIVLTVTSLLNAKDMIQGLPSVVV